MQMTLVRLKKSLIQWLEDISIYINGTMHKEETYSVLPTGCESSNWEDYVNGNCRYFSLDQVLIKIKEKDKY